MTNEQFEALAQLLRMRAGPAQEACRLVLVEGLTHATASERTGVARANVTQRVSAVRAGMALAEVAAGLLPRSQGAGSGAV